jgi:hypothetical protein
MSSLLHVFQRAHPDPKIIMVGLDVRWCVTGDSYEKLTPRPFPDWMYRRDRWRGYTDMFNLFAVQEAGKEFGVLTGLKKRDMGLDGYTRFVPPDSEYDPARAMQHLRDAGADIPAGERSGDPTHWRFPTLELLQGDLAPEPEATRKILFFVPYNHRLLSSPGSQGAAVWDECKRRVVAMAQAIPHMTVLDFMIPSPITGADDNYWDGLHYRVSVADRLARDMAAADRGQVSDDYHILWK